MIKEKGSLSGLIRFFRGSSLVGFTRHKGRETIKKLSKSCELKIPTNCNSGNCGVCMVILSSGIVDLPIELPEGLDSDTIKLNARLSCIGIPRGDVDIELIH